MKRLIAVFACLAVATLAFATGSSQVAEQTGPVTILYSFWGNPDAIGVERDIIDAFQAQNADVIVEPVVSGYGDYHTMLLTRLAGGNPPDVMRVDSYYFADFLQVNALRQIDDLIARDRIDTSVYYQQGIQENTSDGKLYGLPWATSPLMMLVNIKALEDAGIAIPSLNWTWAEAEAIARQFTRGTGESATYGLSFNPTTISSVLPYVWAEGGDLFSADKGTFALTSPQAIRGLERLVKHYRDGLMPPDSITADANALTRWFVNDRIAMRMGSVAEVLSTQLVDGSRFEVYPMPGSQTNPRATVYKSNTIGIATSSRQVEAAWTFMKFLRAPTGEGETLYMRAKRMAPTIDDPRYWEIYADLTKYPRMIYQNMSTISERYGRLLPLRPGWLEVEQLVLPAIQQIMIGERTATAAMADIAPRVQAVLDRTGR